MASTSRLEYSIRQGDFSRNEDGTYSVTVYGAKFPYKERISANDYARICDRIRREDWRHTVRNYTVEHSACMSDIMDAYADYRLSMAY